jgi:hypothetical protein
MIEVPSDADAASIQDADDILRAVGYPTMSADEKTIDFELIVDADSEFGLGYEYAQIEDALNIELRAIGWDTLALNRV